MTQYPVNWEYLMHFLAPRSTKGASKQRRDLINSEIGVLRDLLPLPEAARQRLSQLQIMSLACVYIRKSNYFARLFGETETGLEATADFSQTLTGFLLITTRDGKLLYISENVTEYLGHSMVDMMTQGDSLFDIIDKRDHPLVQSQLMQSGYGQGAGSSVPPQASSSLSEERTFFCRMNVARSFRRQAGFGDHKMMHVKGHFVQPGIRDHYGNQSVFMAICSPLITPDVKDTNVQNSTVDFYSVHGLDMKYTEIGHVGEHHLGYTEAEMYGKSWYELLHPDDIHEAREKHIQLIKSSHEMGCTLTVRLQSKRGHWVWVNIVMHIRQPFVCDNGEPAIVCINHVIDDQESQHFKVQGQLYSSHIARSPEFLGTNQGSNPQHTITHVPTAEGSSYSTGSSFMAQLQNQGSDEGLPYQLSFVASTSNVSSAGQAQPMRGDPSMIHHTQSLDGSFQYTDTSSECCDSSPEEILDSRTMQRADILNKLKRRVSGSSNAQQCRPAKIPRQSNISPRPGPMGYQASAVIANMSSLGNLGGGFSTINNAGIQMLAPAQGGPIYQQLALKKGLTLSEQSVQVIPQPVESLSHFGMKPPTPLTPDSLTSEHPATTDFTQDRLTVDVSDSAIVPLSMLTPEASPVSIIAEEISASPLAHSDPNLEYSGTSLDELSFFPDDPTVKIKQEESEDITTFHMQVVDERRLPVIDSWCLEKMLCDLEQQMQPLAQQQVQQSPPSVAQPEPVPEEPATSNDDNLLHQVTNVLMDMVQQATDGMLDLNQFMVVPDNSTQGLSTIRAEDELANLSVLATIQPAPSSTNDDFTISLDELHQLTSQIDMQASFGDCDLLV